MGVIVQNKVARFQWSTVFLVTGSVES